MMHKLTILFTILPFMLKAMENHKDSTVTIPLVITSYSFQIPGRDLANRFGTNSNIGTSFMIKTKKNWTVGIDGSFIFGNRLRENGILNNISTSGGVVINQNGEYADINLYERGFTSSLSFGKVFSYLGPNANSGLMLTGSIGFLQHKIRIEDFNNTVPQVAGDYKKGYDRLCNGIAFTEFLGYLFLSHSQLVNFYAGFEFIQAFTQSRRTYDFDLMKRDTMRREDLIYGIRLGWVLPLNKKTPNTFYYY